MAEIKHIVNAEKDISVLLEELNDHKDEVVEAAVTLTLAS